MPTYKTANTRDHIFQNGSCRHTVSSLIFHHHSMDRYISRLTVHVYAICHKLNSLVLLRPHSQACLMNTGVQKVFKMAGGGLPWSGEGFHVKNLNGQKGLGLFWNQLNMSENVAKSMFSLTSQSCSDSLLAVCRSRQDGLIKYCWYWLAGGHFS